VMETLLQTIGVIIIYAFGMLILGIFQHRAEIRSMRKNGYDPDLQKELLLYRGSRNYCQIGESNDPS